MKTPNLDALSQRSLYLSSHHCQYPLCNPSRTSLLTGRRADTTLVFDNSKYWREYGHPFTTLPQHLKDSHGFLTLNFGKIFHAPTVVDDDYPHSWSRPVYLPEDHWGKDLSWREISPEQESALPLTDDLTVEQVAKVIEEELAHSDQPFFLAVGLNKPHLPFYAPSRHYLPYPAPEETDLPDNQYIPEGMPPVAWHNYLNELGDYTDITDLGVTGMFNTSMPEFKVRELRRAYYASVSYADEMAGKLFQTLKDNGLENNTMVVVWGDHGEQTSSFFLHRSIPIFPSNLRLAPRRTSLVAKASALRASDALPSVHPHPRGDRSRGGNLNLHRTRGSLPDHPRCPGPPLNPGLLRELPGGDPLHRGKINAPPGRRAKGKAILLPFVC